MTRVVFLGTPQAAVPSLRALAAELEIALVVTQPDRPRGRSDKPVPPPVKEAARELSLPVAQPATAEELANELSSVQPLDLGVVVAYGRILRPEVLDMTTKGFINVHFSLLPRWRGAAPVERALISGDGMTGVTIMTLDEGLDTGPVLTAQAIDIPPDDDAGMLTDRLARLGARLLITALRGYLEGDLEPQKQTDEGATYAKKITRDDRPLNVGGTVDEFVNRVRGLAPDPAATLDIDGQPHKVYRASPHQAFPDPGTWEAHDGVPVVGVADGGIALIELQPPGKNRQAGEDWLRGRMGSEGTVD
jgi:methionyl-tRNA formyltransferase